jgi:aspartate aminotransferase
VSFPLAPRLQNVKPSPTIAVSSKAFELKKLGRDIINLGVGEPDFETPENICRAAIEAIHSGKTKYTSVDGIFDLKRAICEKLERDNRLKYDVSQILVTNGGKQAIFNALLATLAPGDEVIIPSPYWVSYPDIVSLFEGCPVFVEGKLEDGFKILPEALEEAITPQTRWLIFNSPSNPTGATYTENEIKALSKVLLKYPHVLILSDDIYEHLIYDGLRFCNLPQVEPRLYDRTLIVNGVSKAYAMTGWRIGYSAGSLPLIKAMVMLQSQSTTNACSISQSAAVEALSGSQDFLKEWRNIFQQRRDAALEALKKIPGFVSSVPPQGAFYLYISCGDFIGLRTPDGKTISNDEDLCVYLLEEAGVAVVHGAAFGASPCIRLSYATKPEIFTEAVNRMHKACERLV